MGGLLPHAIDPRESVIAAPASVVERRDMLRESHERSRDGKRARLTCGTMRTFVLAPFLLASLGALASLASCSDGGRISLVGAATEDAGDAATHDAGDPSGDATTDVAMDDTCGAAPWVQVGLVVSALSANGTTPLAGAKFTVSLCAGRSTVSDATGNVHGKISKSVPFYARLQKTGYADMLTPEQKYEADTSGVAISMLPSLFTAFIPGFAADKSVVFIGAMKNGGTGDCDKLDGISFAVPGHPEASVTYYSTDQIPAPVGGATSTTTSGRASIAELPPGAPIAITGMKTGCVVETIHGVNTGRAALEPGFVSILGAWVHDP